MKNHLILVLLLLLPAHGATLAHRWSFTANTEDSVSGNTGILQGGASVNTTSLVLNGSGSGTNGNRMTFTSPLNIGGNFGATGVTIETWYTDTGTGTWGKLFQFGNNSAGQELGYTHTRGNGEQSGVDRSGAQLLGEQVSQNEEHHLVITVSPDGNLNTWVDGVQKLTNTNTNDLSNVTTTFEAIGATSWGDPGMRGSVNEFRIWSGELAAQEVSSNFLSGPENLPTNGPLITSFVAIPAIRQEGESAALSWEVDIANLTGTLNVELLDPQDTVIQTSASASGSFDEVMGDTGGVAQDFTYTLRIWDSDTPASVQTTTATVSVTPGIPIANDLSVQTLETTPLAITLTGTDPNAHPSPALTFQVITPPSGGTLTGTPPNLTYTAQSGFSGLDSFTYQASDGKYSSPPASVSIEVNLAPSPPTDLSLSTLDIPITATSGTYLAALTTDDPNSGDHHTYSLVSGPGSEDNNLFVIVGNQLRSNSDFSGQLGNPFSIRIRTTDQTDRSTEREFTLQVIEPNLAIVINEIHANPPENHIPEEFIELFNPSPSVQDLGGWRLSSAVDFVFPPGTTIAPGAFLLIAEDPATLQATQGVTALGPFEGNLNSSGETVRLRNADDEVVDEVDYKVGFPWPVASDGGGASLELINPSLDNSLGSSWRASIPQIILGEATFLPFADNGWSWRPGSTEASSPTSAWRLAAFSEDASWSSNATLPIGYGNINEVTLNTTISEMRSNYSSVFLRNNFEIQPGEVPSQLRLNFTADDGFIVWINGAEVTRKRFDPEESPTIDDTANANGTEGLYEEELIVNAGSFLVEGNNTIAVHLFNVSLTSSDLGFDLAVSRPGQDDAEPRPTPGAQNLVRSDNAAPNIRKVNHTPSQPTSADEITITSLISDPDGISSVSLEYRVIEPGNYIPAQLPLPIVGNNINLSQSRPENPEFEAGWTTITMVDDGSNGDALAGDGLFTAQIPANPHRSLVRYRITVSDSLGLSARVPYPDDPTRNFAYFVYDGVPAYQGTDAATMSDTLPVYHLITRSEDYEEATAYNFGDQINQGTNARFLYNWNATLVYDGVVYDNIRFRLRGANGRYQGQGKRSMRIRLNDGNFLQARDQNGEPFDQKWRTLTLGKSNSNRQTMTFGLNEAINYHLFRKIGIPSATPLFIQWRVIDDENEAPDQWRGDYHGTFFVSETYDVRFMEEHDVEKGNLYKLINQTQDWQRQQRYQARNAIFDGSDHNNIESSLTGNSSPAFIDAHVNLEKWNTFHSLVQATRHYDYWPSANKNMVYYFEPDYLPENNNRGKLWILPWDTDSSWGPTYNSGHDVVYNSIFDADGGGSDNASNPTLWPGYFNAVRELRDLLWQEDQINPLIDDFAAIIDPMVPADFARWKGAPSDAGNYNHLGGPGINSLAGYVQDMKNFAFTGGSWPGGNGSVLSQANDNGVSGTQGRDAFLDYLQGSMGEASLIPNTPTLTYTGSPGFPTNGLVFETSEFSDPQGSGTFAAMEWRLAEVGAPAQLEIEASWESGNLDTFQNSIALPTTAVRSNTSYRARVRHQDNTGRWSHWSEPVEFTTSLPDLSPYLADLVISEFMYHPADPSPAEIAAGFDDDNDFEFIELSNVGLTNLDLSDLRFTKGIDFDFLGSAQTSLAPGEQVLIVNNRQAFEFRYGIGLPIAGEWENGDRLSNSSERVKLSFGAGDAIRDFTYFDDSPWPVEADGSGRSLTLINPESVPGHQLAASWRASDTDGGTPGRMEPSDPFGDWLATIGQTDAQAPYQGSSLSNLLAYALGADLSQQSPEGSLPFIQISEEGASLTYRKRTGSNPVSYLIEVSPDLDQWTSGPGQTNQIGDPIDNGDGTESITVRPIQNSSKLFMRLRIVLP